MNATMEDARSLHAQIVGMGASGCSDPNTCLELPFPSLAVPPERFELQWPQGTFKYMGRKAYGRVRSTVLGLWTSSRLEQVKDLPVRPHPHPSHPYCEACLWGIMGSGKSYVLAALACDLLASFHHSCQDMPSKQRQRVVYLPDCARLLEPADTVRCVQRALLLSYGNDEEAQQHIDMLDDVPSVVGFFRKEARRGVIIYVILDQFNALEPSGGDSADEGQNKAQARSRIATLASAHVIVKGASANNRNAQKWQSKQLNIAKVILHGGLEDDEYMSWKRHFDMLDADEFLLRDETGTVPLFLRCWTRTSAYSPERAWQLFVAMPEVSAAKEHLRKRIKDQLNHPVFKDDFLRMYRGFMTQGLVTALPEDYDCRYLYIDADGIGKCVCGVYRKLIAEALQENDRSCFLVSEWKEAIAREVAKSNPNLSLLGFLVEQETLAQICQRGIPLFADEIIKCDQIVYFTSGSEKHLKIKEGCTLYVPSAFNYPRVDSVIRIWWKSVPAGGSGRGDSDDPKQLMTLYKDRSLHVVGLKITLGSLSNHLKSEGVYCLPAVMEIWHPGWDAKDVGKWFIWYVRQSEMDMHARDDAVELAPCLYGSRKVKRKTRSQSGNPLKWEHVSILVSVEDVQPGLK